LIINKLTRFYARQQIAYAVYADILLRVLAIAILLVCLPVRHTGGSVKIDAS